MTSIYNGIEETVLNQIIPVPELMPANSLGEYMSRVHGRIWRGVVPIALGTGSHTLNVFKVTGSVLVTNQVGIIIDNTTLADCNQVYATYYDGTTSQDLTANGIDLSGVAVGTTFFKDKDPTQTYTMLDASAGQIYEPTSKKEGQPFYCIQKNGADCYIQFNLTTGASVDFAMYLEFTYKLINGATLTLA
jgi:hypothetical protein